ncbi:undecaprenyldiphospho-muramoylpentapeptide beta-N-acetylglucosaminyltransferase [Candidatus Microgenomates bacterium]|nr:undecaprenyldiphospho-muramoylpentapeptide beta-N-acetylglucosaminyltransferase [Candidatus Microgenomates bacterium]
MKKRTLLITGGHVTPALAVIEEVKKNYDWEIVWVGRKFAMEGETISSLEYEIIPQLGIPFYNLETARLQRKFTKWTIPALLRLPKGMVQAFWLLWQIKPRVILSFGGYISVPMVFAGWLLRIPIILHEQTAASGLANRTSAQFANHIAISYQSSFIDFPHHKAIVTGNPVRRSILRMKRHLTHPPAIFITGGSQGSRTINYAVNEILTKLIGKFTVFHQTGYADYEKLEVRQKRLDENQKEKYHIFPVVDPNRLAEILGKSSLVIGRSGANTVTEIAAIGIPAIFIPLPYSERGEQEKNAKMLADINLARIISQNELTGKLLWETINDFLAHPPDDKVKKEAKKLIHKNAAAKIVSLINRYME